MSEMLAATVSKHSTLASELTLVIPLALLFIVFIVIHLSLFVRRSRAAGRNGSATLQRPPDGERGTR